MLKRVSIQNFKSLKDVTLDLQKVNLLIGPNNSGKTNFLKALEYISKCAEGEKILNTQTQYKRNSVNQLKIDLIYQSPYGKNKYDHIFTNWLEDEEGEETGSYSLLISHSDNLDMDIHSQFVDCDRIEFKKICGIISIYKIDPNKLDKPAPVGEGAKMVNTDASNLVAFVDYILGEYRETAFRKIQNDLHKCVPEFTEINLQNVKATDELVKQFGPSTFKRLGLTDGNQGVKYWADELSEGTLYFIALLCIINQPNPPKLLLLEEPEKGIHPRRIREVMDFIFRLAEEKDVQIILTSHNEHVLDDFATRPEAVFVFDKDVEGATYVRNLQKDIIEPTNQRNKELGLDEIDLTTNLSENWLYGLLGGVPAIP